MSDTTRLELPLLQAAQAQKHVTVNEAFEKLDALVQLSIDSAGATVAPLSSVEGEVHAIGSGATGDWLGQDGMLAVFANNGWLFVEPRTGWRGWRVDTGSAVTFDGVDWVEGAGSLSASGAGFVHRTIEIDHAVSSGATSTIADAIPANSVVYGVTGRVLSLIGGAASFQIGADGSADRYGSGIGVVAGAWARGLTGSPLTYYVDTDIVLTGVGGNFDGSGVFRLAIHVAELTLPRF